MSDHVFLVGDILIPQTYSRSALNEPSSPVPLTPKRSSFPQPRGSRLAPELREALRTANGSNLVLFEIPLTKLGSGKDRAVQKDLMDDATERVRASLEVLVVSKDARSLASTPK